ncbi:hypothetical protein BIU97_07340 [Curtobacterium sp. MCBA15_009]|nr:hypothetical protein BIU97_07340 [Curtobacterium sp. MCBA15_009]
MQHLVDPLVMIQLTELAEIDPLDLEHFVFFEGERRSIKRAEVGHRHVPDMVTVGVDVLEKGAAVGADDADDFAADAEFFSHFALQRGVWLFAGFNSAADQAPPSRVALSGDEEAIAVLDDRGHPGKEKVAAADLLS